MKVLIKCQTVIVEHLGSHTECVYLIHLAAVLPFGDGYESKYTHTTTQTGRFTVSKALL